MNEEVAYNKSETIFTYSVTNTLENAVETLYIESTVKLSKNTIYSYDENGNQYSSVETILRPAGNEAILALSQTDSALVTMTVNEYDVWNQLVKTSMAKNGEPSEVVYTYDGDGIRTGRTVAAGESVKSVTYVTNGGMVLSQTGNDTATYVRALGYVAKIGAENGVHYYQYNGHGDVVQVASGVSGAVENRYDYDAFGEAVLAVEEVANDIRYSGEFYDAAAGLYCQRARYYDPALGQFTQEDTYRGDEMDPGSLNLYAYCAGDPVNYVDPSGHARVWNDFSEVIGNDPNADKDYTVHGSEGTDIHGGGEQANVIWTGSGSKSGSESVGGRSSESNQSGSSDIEPPVNEGKKTDIEGDPDERVTVFNAETGEKSECYRWELDQKRAGDGTGTWRTANEKVTVYDATTGKQSECEAWELYGKRVGDDTGTWRTGGEMVAVYAYGTGHKSYCRYDEIESKRAGDKTGQWGLAGDYIPVYSLVQGKTVYVRGDAAQSYVRNDNIQYSKANRKPGKTPPTKWPKLPDNLGGKNQAGIQKDIGTVKEGAIRGMTALMVREQIVVKGGKEATGTQRNRATKEDGIQAANCFLLLKAIMTLLGGLILGQ